MRLAKIFGHPIHQGLIVLPLGLFTAALAFDVAFLTTRQVAFADVSYWMIVGGILGALLAAAFGLWDLLSIPSGTRAKAIGIVHGLVNVLVVAVFVLSWEIRRSAGHVPGMWAVALAVLGLAISSVGGWLGGELVLRYGVGVKPGANAEPLPERRRRNVPGRFATSRR